MTTRFPNVAGHTAESGVPAPPDDFSRPSSRLVQRLVALDIDGTLVGNDGKIPTGTVDAIDLVRAAGHKVVLATGRSLVGLIPVATRLGLAHEFSVCSNGTVTVRLDPAAASGYVIQEARRFEPGSAIHRALGLVPEARVGVEELGWGWHVNREFDSRLLNGQQKRTSVAELSAAPATRVVLHARGIARHAEDLASVGVTAIPAGTDWLDVTGPGTSKAAALERLRQHLRISTEATIAVGDGINDLDLLSWAARGVAMGHAPAAVRAAANETTGTIRQNGAVSVLRSLLPDGVDTASLSPLAAQLATALQAAPGPAVLRVWSDQRPGISRCDLWTLEGDVWIRHSPIPSGAGATMREIEAAAREADLFYPRGQIGRRRAHWRSTRDSTGRPGFELPLGHGREASWHPIRSEVLMR